MTLAQSAAAMLLTTLVLAPASMNAQGEAAPGRVQVYDCDNLSRVVVRLFPDRLEWPAMRATLTRTGTSADAAYSDANITFRTSGNYALIEEPQGAYSCRANSAEAPWEEARLRGIEVRAAGDEPTWQLEMTAHALEFVAEGGTTRIAAQLSKPLVDPDMGRTVISARTEAHVVRVVIEQHLCWFRSSSVASSSGVTVTVDGNKVYRGCGRPLMHVSEATATTIKYDASRFHGTERQP